MKGKVLILLLFAISLVNGVTWAQNPYANFKEQGKATFYSKRAHKHKTSSGERHDSYGFVAAHKTLPFHSIVKVTNPANGKSTLVRINDRGPFAKGRVIDLSLAAAKELGIISKGVATVDLEVVSYAGSLVAQNATITDSTEASWQSNLLPYEALVDNRFALGSYYDTSGLAVQPKGYGLHADNFGVLENALQCCKKLSEAGVEQIFIHPRANKGMLFYRVIVGQSAKAEDLKKLAKKIRDMGHSGLPYKFKTHPAK